MLALDRPVITGEPEMVGLTKVALVAVKEPVKVLADIVELVTVPDVNVPPVIVAVEVTVPVRVAPLIVGVVSVLLLRVWLFIVPTTTPSPVIIPWTWV
jgi:hypothetical protein